MSHYIADVKAGIVSVLTQSTKAKKVYDYEETKPQGYPCIMVTPLEGDSEFLDTMRYKWDFGFTLRCYQERLEVGASEAERILTALVDEVLSVFDTTTNSTLNNTVVFVKPAKYKFGYLQSPDADVRSCEITLVGEAAQ